MVIIHNTITTLDVHVLYIVIIHNAIGTCISRSIHVVHISEITVG